MTTDAFNRLIEATKSFASKYSAKVIHQYIRLEFRSDYSEVTAIAVDGCRMSVEHAVCNADEDFVVYVKSNIKLPRRKNVVIELTEDEAVFRCDGFIFGYQQPHGEFLNWESALPKDEPTFRIAFNGEYLLSALQAARVSVGGTYKNPIVLEFRSPVEPVIIKTNGKDVKMVLPIRIKE